MCAGTSPWAPSHVDDRGAICLWGVCPRLAGQAPRLVWHPIMRRPFPAAPRNTGEPPHRTHTGLAWLMPLPKLTVASQRS